MFVYEDGRSLVLAAGVPREWLEGIGVRVERFRTEFGELNYSMSARDSAITLDYELKDGVPEGGIVFSPPGPGQIRSATLDGVPVTPASGTAPIVLKAARGRLEIRTDR
jgi:hypothetical protein